MRRKIGLNIDCIKDGSNCENIQKLKNAGFDCFFVLAIREDVDKYKKISEDVGIYFEFIHAPFRGINAIWEEGDGYATLFDQMMETVDAAAEYGVPTVIIHLSSGWNPPAVNELGLKRYDKLVAHATEKKINIAFENLRNVENVLVIKERYKDNPYVGFCYDAGHEHCYTDNFDWIETFGDKLLCTHIHDNTGYDRSIDNDTHYLPFDGNVDYEDMIRRLDKVGYKGSLMLEVFNKQKPEYLEWSEDKFIKECYERIKRIEEMSN
jgi:sugar phosphate isomerase/epimerase